MSASAETRTVPPRPLYGSKPWRKLRPASDSMAGLSPTAPTFLLDAVGRELFQGPPKPRAFATTTGSYGSGKEWRFLRNDRTAHHHFLAFANARGSSSLRYF